MAIVLPKLSRRRAPVYRSADQAPALSVDLCHADGEYRIGQVLSARWRIHPAAKGSFQGLEASVLWFTEGKGDVDLQVHAFQHWNEAELRRLDRSQWHGFRCELPSSPLSYQGTLLRICWCVRVRLFFDDSREIVVEKPFRLAGHVPGGIWKIAADHERRSGIAASSEAFSFATMVESGT